MSQILANIRGTFVLVVLIFYSIFVMNNQQWETNKENVLPVKEGRSVTTLNRALKVETPQKDPFIKSKIRS
jgi:hypothetical protein